MKRVWLYMGIAVALAGAATIAVSLADPLRRGEPDAAADAMPPYEVLAAVRGLGFSPITQPTLRGNHYVLRAYDPRGVEMRILADAQFGDVVSATPIVAAASNASGQQVYSYGANPRIIQVPDNYRSGVIHVPEQRTGRERNRPREAARPKPESSYGRSVTTPDLDDLSTHDDFDALPAPDTRQQKPEKKNLPPLRSRRVLEAPQRPDGGLSPVYPTNRFRSRVDEFGQPPEKKPAQDNLSVNTTGPDNPPIGYTPPKIKGTIRVIEPARSTSDPSKADEPSQEPAQSAASASTEQPAEASADPVAQKIEPAAQSSEASAEDAVPADEVRDPPK